MLQLVTKVRLHAAALLLGTLLLSVKSSERGEVGLGFDPIWTSCFFILRGLLFGVVWRPPVATVGAAAAGRQWVVCLVDYLSSVVILLSLGPNWASIDLPSYGN